MNSGSSSNNEMKKLLEKCKKLPEWVKETIQKNYDGNWGGVWINGTSRNGYLMFDGQGKLMASLFGESKEKITDEMIAELLQCIELFGNRVKVLGFSENKITSKGGIELLDGLKQMKSRIIEIRLGGNQLDDECMKSIGEFIQSSITIEDIGIGENKMTDKGIELLYPYLEGNTTLKTLYLYGNQGITDKSVPILLKMIQAYHISNIHIGETSITQQNVLVLPLISNILKYDDDNIYLYGRSVTDDDIVKISDLMKQYNYGKVKQLDLSSNKGITDKSVPLLIDIAKKSGITSFGYGFSETSISDENKMKIIDSLKIPEEKKKELINLIKTGGTAPLNRAKIMTAGKGRAGKSATIRSLTGKQYNPNLESTIGADTANNDCQVDRLETDGNWKGLNEKEKKEISLQHYARAMKKNKNKESESKDISTSGPAKTEQVASVSTPSQSTEIKSEQINIETNKNDDEENDKMELKAEFKMYLNDDNIDNKISMSIWDLGGQKVFYTLHHLFLTKYAVYLLVFDMRELISSNEQTKIDEALDYIKRWLESIQTHANGAPIFMIGTFKDEINDENDHEDIDLKIRDMIDDKMKTFNKNSLAKNKDAGLLFWPLDNSKGPDGEDIKKLRKAIMETVEKQQYLKEDISLRWTKVYDEMLESKKDCFTMKEFKEKATKNKLIDENYQIEMLKRFHELGMLLYFDKGGNELSNIIVLNPQWLVNAITMVIRNFDMKDHHFPKDLWDEIKENFRKEFKKLADESIISKGLLYLLWKGLDKESDCKIRDFLLSLMEKMTLIAPWNFDNDSASASTSETRYYLIPSNLRLFKIEQTKQKMDEINNEIAFTNIDDIAQEPKSKYLVIDFSQSYLPIGFYDRLICKLVDYASTYHENNRKPIVSNGSMFASIGEYDFRVDEDLINSRIIVAIHQDCEKPYLVLEKIELIVDLVNKEAMDGSLKYNKLVGIWINDKKNLSLVDIDEAKKANQTKKETILALNKKDRIKISDISQVWKWSEIRSQEELGKGEIIGFLSHMKVEAAAHARLLKNEGEKYLAEKINGPFKGSKLFLDSDNLTDLRKLTDDLKKMKVMIVLLSKSYLTRPWCLAELYTAIKNDIPIITVVVSAGDDFTFQDGKKMILGITKESLTSYFDKARKDLEKEKFDVDDMIKTIYEYNLSHIIAQELNASAGEGTLHGQITDIMNKALKEIEENKSQSKKEKRPSIMERLSGMFSSSSR